MDAAIRGAGRWPGLTAEKLLDDEVFPVASAAFARRHCLRRPEQLLQLPLLRSTRQSWQQWFVAAGLPSAEAQHGPILQRRRTDLPGRRAQAGRGLGRSSAGRRAARRRAVGGALAPARALGERVLSGLSRNQPAWAAFVQFRGWLLHQLAVAAPSNRRARRASRKVPTLRPWRRHRGAAPAQKRFGQHFLHDPGLIRRIVQAVAPRPGPTPDRNRPPAGRHHLPLLREAGQLTVIELDRDLIPRIQAAARGRGRTGGNPRRRADRRLHRV